MGTKGVRHKGYSDPEFFSVASCFRQSGQYQGAGVLTGFGLLLRHLAHRKRLPLTAVFGRTFFPVLSMFLAIGASTRILSERWLAPRLRRGVTDEFRPALLNRAGSLLTP